METRYKKVFKFEVSEDELNTFRQGIRIAVQSKGTYQVDEFSKILSRLNVIAEGKNEYQTTY